MAHSLAPRPLIKRNWKPSIQPPSPVPSIVKNSGKEEGEGGPASRDGSTRPSPGVPSPDSLPAD